MSWGFGQNKLDVKGCRALKVSMVCEKREEQMEAVQDWHKASLSSFQHSSHTFGCGHEKGMKKRKNERGRGKNNAKLVNVRAEVQGWGDSLPWALVSISYVPHKKKKGLGDFRMLDHTFLSPKTVFVICCYIEKGHGLGSLKVAGSSLHFGVSVVFYIPCQFILIINCQSRNLCKNT